MKRIGVGIVAVLLASAHGSWSQQKAPHVMLRAPELVWGAAPPALPKGAEIVVLSGDPGANGPFSLRLRMPPGYKIAPHWHPTDEHVTVVSGTFSMGMGEKFDRAATKDLPAGGYALMPAEHRHFAWTRQGAIVQVHGIGPFAITYVNPADDPRSATAK